jgi:hypothetical protein
MRTGILSNNLEAPGITAGAHLGCPLDSIQNAVHIHPKSSMGTGTSSSQWFSLTDLKLLIPGGVGNLFILVTQKQTLVATSSTAVDPAAVENFLQSDFKLENQTTCASVSANFRRWDACNQRVFKSQDLRFAKEFGIDFFVIPGTKDVTTSSFFEKVTK